MNISLYEYGLDMQLKEAVEILRGGMGKNLSKKDKDIRIAETIGIIETVRQMVIVSDPEQQATDAGD